MKVLIAVDFSPVGCDVAEHGYLQALKNGMDATFFHCTPKASVLLMGYAGVGAYVPINYDGEQAKIDDAASARFRQIIEDVYAKHGKPESIKTDLHIAHGDAGEEILRYAKENKYDLIIAGYKSYSTIEHMLVGSTATKIVRYAPCSVLIYRPADAE